MTECFSKCGPWTSSISVIWELVSKINPRADSQSCWIRSWMRSSHLYFNMNFRWFYARFRLRTDFHHLNHHQDQKRSKSRSAGFTRARLAIQGKKRSAFAFSSQGQLLLAKNTVIKQHWLHSVSKHGRCHNSLIRSLSFFYF